MDLKDWQQLTREQKRDALINFQEPDNLYQAEKYEDLREEKI